MAEGDAGAAGRPKPSNAKPALSSVQTTGSALRPVATPATGPAVTGRRPLVSKEAKEQRAAAAAARRPFYLRLPKAVTRALLALVVVAVLVPLCIWGYGAFRRSLNPDEYEVRAQLYAYRFDNDEAHFANLDAMGPKATDIAIKFLVDPTPAEITGGHSTTTAGELAMMYLMHCAARLKIDPPPKAAEAMRNGLPILKPAQWTELQQVWTAWLADAQAKGLAPK